MMTTLIGFVHHFPRSPVNRMGNRRELCYPPELMTTKPLDLRTLVAEAIGTFGIVFAGCGSIMVASRFGVVGAGVIIPAVFGLIVAVMIYALGHLSGAHFNPAVTLAFATARHFPVGRLLPYWVAQCLGAVIAMFLLTLLLPAGLEFGATIPKVTAFQALGWEFILTFFLMFVVMSVATDTRAVGTMAGVAVGGTVALAAYLGGPVTGASLNPARSLAPAIWHGNWGIFWVYVAGPMLGAVSAALLYEWIRGSKTSEDGR